MILQRNPNCKGHYCASKDAWYIIHTRGPEGCKGGFKVHATFCYICNDADPDHYEIVDEFELAVIDIRREYSDEISKGS